MKKSMLIALAAAVALSLAACSSVAQEPLDDLEPLASGEPIASSELAAGEPVSVSELRYFDLTDEHKVLFGEISPMFDESIKLGNMSAEDASKELDKLILGLVEEGRLPSNAVDLFHQYRDEMGITFPELEPQPEVVLNDGTSSQPVQGQQVHEDAPNKPDSETNSTVSEQNVSKVNGSQDSSVQRELPEEEQNTMSKLLPSDEPPDVLPRFFVEDAPNPLPVYFILEIKNKDGNVEEWDINLHKDICILYKDNYYLVIGCRECDKDILSINRDPEYREAVITFDDSFHAVIDNSLACECGSGLHGWQ